MDKFGKRFPYYFDDSDYQTNAPSYYDDLARKNKLIQRLAEKIWDYEKELADSLEEIEDILNNYIVIVDGKLELIDYKIGEGFNEEIEQLLREWVSDGTLNHIINTEIFNHKADKDYVEDELAKKEVELAKKADKDYVEDELAKKEEELAKKEDLDTLEMFVKEIETTSDSFIFKGENVNFMFDFGHDFSAIELQNFVKDKGINRLDYAFISHYHGDHVGGLQSFIDSDIDMSECIVYLPVSPRWDRMTSTDGTSASTVETLVNRENVTIDFLEARNIEYRFPNDEQVIQLDENIYFKFLNVGEDHYRHYYDDLVGSPAVTDYNNFSMVGEVHHKDRKFLIASDISLAAQKQLAPYLSTYDVVTLEHHGLNVYSDPDYLDRISPKIAIGMNGMDTNFTRNETIKNLWFKGSQIFITGQSGDIHLVSGNQGLNVYTEKGSYSNREMLKSQYYLDVSNQELIRANDDLNDFKKAGVYISGSGVISSSLVNSPTNQTFRMNVEFLTGGNSIVQIIKENTVNGKEFIRNYHAGSWRNWREVITTDTISEQVATDKSWFKANPVGRINIKENDDLNNHDTIGVYINASGAVTPTLQNKPVKIPNSSFKMIVEQILGSNHIRQTMLLNGVKSDTYIRTKSSGGTWGAWQRLVFEDELETMITVKVNDILDSKGV